MSNNKKFFFSPFYFLFLICICSQPVVAQTTTNPISVTGELADSVSHERLSFASVMLKNQKTLKEFVQNTDSLGRFHFTGIPSGDYIFKAYYVGYPQLQRHVRLSSNPSKVNMGTVYMHAQKNVIGTVHIVDFKKLIDQRPDGIVYHADKDPTNKGAMAADVLRKVPMLTVDMDDNLELRGNGNVRVLIDGKPSKVIAGSVSDVLKQLPSDNIKSVEVITSPGAKYDAEGSAGVVNIITKHQSVKGLSGRVFTGIHYNTVDETLKGYGGAHLNYRHNKFGISASLGGGHWSHTSHGNSVRRNHPGTAEETVLKQTNSNDGGGNFIWGRLSANYTIDSLNSISAGLGIHPGTWTSTTDQTTLFPAQGLNYDQHTVQSSPRHSYSFNAGYNKKFKDNPHHTLDFLALYTLNDRNQDYHLNQNNLPENILNYQEKNANNTKDGELTFQADYAQPFRKHHQKFEAGLKYINRNESSDYNLYTWSDTTSTEWLLDPNRTNLLNYTQQVAAAYAQFTSDLTKRLSIIGGVRYEFTDINGDLRDNGGRFHSQFNNVLPSVILSYKVREYDRLKLSYTQRIERPSIRYINPYINSSDPLNITQGNPELGPEQTHKFELDYNTVLGHSSIDAAVFYSLTRNGIEAFTDINPSGVAFTSYGNYGKGHTVGLNLFGGTTLFGRWRINLNGNLYYKSLSGGDLNTENQGWDYDAHFTSNVTIYKGLSVSAFAMYRGRRVMLQGTKSGWYRYSLGLKQTILKGKGDISLSAENFFSPTTVSVSDFNYGDALYHTVNYRAARGFRIGFSYNFGKMSFKKQPKEIKNTDLKQSQDQNQTQGMGGGM